MEIQKIFNEQGGEDKIYSVLLSESEYEIYQKEFGFKDDFKSSGLKRALKKKIGNIRRNLAWNISDSILKDKEKQEEAFLKSNRGHITDNAVKEKIHGEARKKGIVVNNLDITGEDEPVSSTQKELVREKESLLEDAKEFNPGKDKDISKFKENLEDSRVKFQAFVPSSGYGLDSEAHEIGHGLNFVSRSPKRKLISKLNKKVIGEYNLDKNNSNRVKKSGLGKVINNYVSGKIIESEESSASKSGLELLKRGGLLEDSPKYKQSKENLENSLETYKRGNKIRTKTSLKDTIQIDSRKGLSVEKEVRDKNKRRRGK